MTQATLTDIAGEEIQTREGTLNAQEGDLIIEGVRGEVYPIGPEILAETYVPDPDDEEAMEIYRECLPEGVVVEFEDMGNVTIASGIYVDTEGLDAEERETAVRFTRSFMETAPHLRDDGEIAYSGRF